MKKIYAVATESGVVLAFESRSDADEYAGEHDGMAVLPVPCVGAYEYPSEKSATDWDRIADALTCGHDIDALGQDNMGVDAPLCEDCWGEQQSHTVAVPRREARNLRFENARLREKLDAGTEETAVQNLRKGIESAYEASRERALALTKLDECELWLGRCEPRVTASPTLKGAAQDAAMPCLKAEEAHGFAMPDVNVEVTAEELAKSLREAMKPAMRMAVE